MRTGGCQAGHGRTYASGLPFTHKAPTPHCVRNNPIKVKHQEPPEICLAHNCDFKPQSPVMRPREKKNRILSKKSYYYYKYYYYYYYDYCKYR